MTGLEPSNSTPALLSERIQKYLKEIEFLVKQGGEQPNFEFKRTVSLAKDNLDARLDFIKFIQGVANAEINHERCIVVGADPKEKKFFPVTNADDFDPAKVSQLLGAYLNPAPRFEIFPVNTEGGEPIIVIVLDAHQPRPIVVTKQGHTTLGKARLEVGDVWIKRNTALEHATRAELDQMYSVRIEGEAEDRARKRLKHLAEISSVQHLSQPASTIRIPNFALLVGPKSELHSFAQELIATGDARRFRMLLELAREPLINGWDNLGIRGNAAPSDLKQFVSAIAGFFKNEFLPSLESVVELGLLTIKFEAEETWFAAVNDLLIEAFEASRGLYWLKSGQVIQQPDSIPWWRPAFDLYVAMRVGAIYSVARNRLRFMGTILPRTVIPISVDDRPALKTPVLFWPFLTGLFNDSQFVEGRASLFWKERIGAAWGKHFGIMEKFLACSAQLEFLLEWNSYMGGNIIQNPKFQQWLNLNASDVSFYYYPDLYSQNLKTVAPIAEHIYDSLAADPRFPDYLAVDVRIFNRFFRDTQPDQRLDIYAGFLHYLQAWQQQVMFQKFHRLPFFFGWEGRLKAITDNYQAQHTSK